MRVGIGCRLKAAAIFFVLLALLVVTFAGVTPVKAGARASLRAYLTVPPNSWEMMGYNVPGTAAKFVVDTMGWDVFRTFGNVGIGDGSVRALNMSSNVNDIGYTDNNFMAGDVTTAPWDPSRITDFSIPGEYLHRGGGEEQNNTTLTLKNNTNAVSEPEDNVSVNGGGSSLEKNGEQEANRPAEVSFGDISGNIALNDPFHSMLVGRPVGDLLYEHPHAISANMYARLVGVSMPGGPYANVGMRAIGYGY